MSAFGGIHKVYQQQHQSEKGGKSCSIADLAKQN